jgi:PAS domain S-box-containing protein
MNSRTLFLFLIAMLLPAGELPLKVFATADGLASNRVNKIFSDSRGFLWFCTEDGLSRFDGTRFLNLGTGQGLPYPVVTDIVEARDGIYWVATNDGFATLDATGSGSAASAAVRIRKFTVASEAAPNRINVLYRDRRGVLWLGTDGGVFTLEENNGDIRFHGVAVSLPYPALVVQTWAILEDREGSVWIGTKYGLIRKLPDGRTVWYSIQPKHATDHVLSLVLDRTGVMWVGHETGLFQFRPLPASKIPPRDPAAAVVQDDTLERARDNRAPFGHPKNEGEARFLPLGLRVRALHEFADGRIWSLTSFGGVNEYDDDHYQPVNANRSVMKDLSAAIGEDRDGNVWLGTESSGAIRLSPQGFVSFGPAEGLNTQLAGLAEYDDRRMMVLMGAMQIGWLNRDPPGGDRLSSKIITAPEPSQRWGSVQSLLHDHLGDWWVGTRAGLYRFPATRDPDHLLSGPPKAIFTTKDGLAENLVQRLYEDSRGDIWISSFAPAHEPITRWERRTGNFIRYSDRDGLPAFSAPNSFTEDRAGDLWITFREGGLVREHAGKFRYFGVPEGLPPGQTLVCFLDHADRMWCPTLEHGVMRIDHRGESHLEPVIYTTRQGLSSDLVYAITEDTKGRIYFGWSQGLDRLDLSTNEVRHFNVNDGLAAGRVLQVLRDREGSIWVATRTGFSRLVEASHPTPAQPSPVSITRVRIAGAEVPVSPLGVRELSIGDLAPDKNSLQIDYLRISFALGDPLRFQYQLDGADSGWSEPTFLQTVNYASLRAGSYRFQVRAVGPADEAVGVPAVVALRILPPLWLRWWAITGLIAVVVLSFIAFERYRNARMQELGAALLQSQVLSGALGESEARFRTLAETASDAIVTTDAEGTIVFVNSAAERIFGSPTAQMMGRSLISLLPDSMEHVHMGVPPSWEAVEMTETHAGGRPLTLEVSFAEFDRENRRYFTAVARDITERKQADEALRRSREDRIAELERVRRGIAADLHDDIGSSLTQISVLSEVVQKRFRDPEFSVSGPLSYIARASSELIDSMSDIVWAINPQRDRLSDLLHRMRRFAADTFTARNIEFQMLLPYAAESSEQDFRVEGNLRREVFLIFKESVNNIVRHSACSRADIELKLTSGRMDLTIRDNGVGFDPREENEGHGLISMRNRAEEIGVEYRLTSIPGTGTSIFVSVPIPL